PVHTVDGGRELAVDTNGIAWVYSPSTGSASGFDATGASTQKVSLPGKVGSDTVELSAVGDEPVVLDVDTRQLLLHGSDPVSLQGLGQNPRLQLPGPDVSQHVVYVATDQGLYSVPLGGGSPSSVLARGNPGAARPLVLGDCAFAAWS